jgi:TolB-like protein/DNA-binding SARP family transcriptional activator
MNSNPSFRIQLFGSPQVTREAGEPVGGRATQRHRLGLLALLSLAPGRRLSRDKLQGYLWPEKDGEAARQLLNQAVYTLRKSLGEEVLLSEGEDIRLNESLADVDVLDFMGALADGEHEKAARLYPAPFLDGFFISEAPEFERWVERERDRLATAYGNTLEVLAARATANGDHLRAVELWKTRAAQEPHDSRVAVRLIEALEASGNRAGALRHASIHERLLRGDFGTEPAPEVVALVERLRLHPVTADLSGPGQSETAVASGRATDEGRLPGPTEGPAASAPPPEVADHSLLQGSDSGPGTQARTSESTFVSGPPRGQLLRFGIAAAALLAVIAIGLQLRPAPRPAGTPDPSSAAGQVSIAVLPLANLSTDPADAVIADGMTEELIATLARVQELRVIASTSAFAVRDRRLDLRSAAESLGVSHVLEGSLQKVGSRVRIRLRLADGRDGSALWAENYDRELSDVLALQEDVARSVANALGVQLRFAGSSGDRRLPTANVAAYELYLRGIDRTLLRSEGAAAEGLALLYRAVALDSGYAAAWAGIARLHGRLSLPASPRNSSHAERAESAARRAVALDESLPEAQATLGLVLLLRLDLPGAGQHMRRALALDPNRAMWHEWIVHLYLLTGEPDRALAHARRALDLDPLSPYAHAEVARVLAVTDRCDEALPILQRLSALEPPLLRIAPLVAQCHAVQGRWDMAIAAIQRQADAGRPRARALRAFLLARSGAREEALGTRAALVEEWNAGQGEAYAIAIVDAGLGNMAEAVHWLTLALDDGSFTAGTFESPIVFGPLFADVRRHPRFADFAARLRSTEPGGQKR